MTPESSAVTAAVPAKMAEAMNRLWLKFQPEIDIRMTLLETASSAFATGALTIEQREAAHAAAHKLSGTLGTFGLHRGTELARQAELALAQVPITATPAELAAWIAELQALIQNRT